MAFNGASTKRKEQACEITVKMAQNFHVRTKKFTEKDAFRLQAKKWRERQSNYTLSFIFNFVLRIIYIATFQNSVA